MCLDDPLVPIRGSGLRPWQRAPDECDFEKKIGQEIAAFAANDEMDGYWCKELQALNRLIWLGAIIYVVVPMCITKTYEETGTQA